MNRWTPENRSTVNWWRNPPPRSGPLTSSKPAPPEAAGIGWSADYDAGAAGATETEWIDGNRYGTSVQLFAPSGDTNNWPVVVPT
jgi:hypothetical protein